MAIAVMALAAVLVLPSPQPASAADACPDVTVDGLGLTFPDNDCHYKVINKSAGWSEHCTSWANNSARTCRTLTDGNAYKVDKWTSGWGSGGSHSFTAQAPTTPTTPPTGAQACKPLPGVTTNFNLRDRWTLCSGSYNHESRPYFSSGWAGTGSVTRSSNSRQFSVRWRNDNTTIENGGSHEEFDISVGRTYSNASAYGYGLESANSMGSGHTLTSVGRFTRPVVDGRAHVQAIIWLTNKQNEDYNLTDGDNNCLSGHQSSDITVVEWVTDNYRQAYNTVRTSNNQTIPSILSSKTRFVDSVNIGGMTYEVFKRDPGDYCEKVSYFLIRKWNQDYNAGAKYTKLDMAEVISDVATVDNKAYLKNWYVAFAGWEIAGANQSRGANNSQAEFAFSCISLPSLTGSTPPDGLARSC